MNTLFDDHYNQEEIKPLMRIGSLGLVKYTKQIEKPVFKTKKRGITNQRQQIIEEIRTTINQERESSPGYLVSKKLPYDGTNRTKITIKKYPPITGRALAIKFSHIPTNDLYFLISQGKDYKARGKGEFGKYVFGAIKVKKV